MKKLILSIAACGLLLGWGCSEGGDRSDTGRGEMVIELTTAGMDSRADLYTGDPTHNIRNCHLHIFKKDATSGDFVYHYYQYNQWGPEVNTLSISVGKDILVPGDYKFLAVGRIDGCPFEVPVSPEQGVTTFEEYTATEANTAEVTEIFSGAEEKTITAEHGIKVPITMTRKVGGVLMYVKNVPKMVGTKESKRLCLTADFSYSTIGLGNGVATGRSDVLYNLIEIDLSSQASTNGVWRGNPVPEGIQRLDYSQLKGAYAMPTGTDEVSMKLVLYGGEDGTEELRKWDIVFLNQGRFDTFRMESNTLYVIGRKLRGNTTYGDDPDSPYDDDAAVDLAASQIIDISIAPDWNTQPFDIL